MFTYELYVSDDRTEIGRLVMHLADQRIQTVVDIRGLAMRAFYVVLVQPGRAISATRLRDQFLSLEAAKAPKPEPVYCVECGAATELECICDDLNHAVAQECTCGAHNEA